MKGEDGKIVRRPKQFKKEKESDRVVRALHIEVPRQHKGETYKMLQNCFGLGSKCEIQGRRLMMVPTIRDTTPTPIIRKIKHLIEKTY